MNCKKCNIDWSFNRSNTENIKTMKKIKLPHFVFTTIAIILGASLFKQFDFETLKFEQLALSIVYLIGFVLSIYAIMNDYKKQAEK